MLTIILLLVFLVVAIVVGLVLTKKYVKSDKTKKILLIVSSLSTLLIHYSSLIYHAIGHAVNPNEISSALRFLFSNPNLAYPIYPCNIMMIACIIYGFIYDKNKKLGEILCDFIICFGIVSGVGGLFANADYFAGTVLNYDIYKSAIAHAVMIYNIFLLIIFKLFKLDTLKNVKNTFIGCVGMLVVGLYCSFITLALLGPKKMVDFNCMFLFRSPFNPSDHLLTFWVVIPLFLIALFGVLTLIEVFTLPKEKRWYVKIKK